MQASLLEDDIKQRTKLLPLLVNLSERRREKLHYIGVSFVFTLDLFRFGRKHRFAPFYIAQIPNAVMGEHTCMVGKPLQTDLRVDTSDEWGFFGPFYRDFTKRFLLGSTFCSMEYKLAMRLVILVTTVSPLIHHINFMESEPAACNSDAFLKSINEYTPPHNRKRLQAYAYNLADFHLVAFCSSTFVGRLVA
ncbi:hypothetical protein Cgig2_020017 [Carnegiea gigantea]|uniref:Uncharacterized protein n=1 Tax=Carnegiea gigantea TaxID=171969 RepID=A0A9Q1KDS7_9CARY|nr:hypothetical protein Cgig2_020017 [Carnegiea gigantea]